MSNSPKDEELGTSSQQDPLVPPLVPEKPLIPRISPVELIEYKDEERGTSSHQDPLVPLYVLEKPLIDKIPPVERIECKDEERGTSSHQDPLVPLYVLEKPLIDKIPPVERIECKDEDIIIRAPPPVRSDDCVAAGDWLTREDPPLVPEEYPTLTTLPTKQLLSLDEERGTSSHQDPLVPPLVPVKPLTLRTWPDEPLVPKDEDIIIRAPPPVRSDDCVAAGDWLTREDPPLVPEEYPTLTTLPTKQLLSLDEEHGTSDSHQDVGAAASAAAAADGDGDGSCEDWFSPAEMLCPILLEDRAIHPGQQPPISFTSRNPSPEKYRTIPGAANQDGTDFEIKMCALVFLRAVQSNSSFISFKMVSNYEPAGVFDDIVFSYGSPRHEQYILVHLRFTPRKIINFKGKSQTSLKRYFKSLEESNTRQFFKNSTYVFFTNADVKLTPRVKSVPSPAKELLCTTSEPDDVVQVDLNDDICEDFRNDTGAEDFVNRFLIFRNQSAYVNIDKLITQELMKISNCHERWCQKFQKILVEKIRDWWRKPDKTPLDGNWEEWSQLKVQLCDVQKAWVEALDEGDLAAFEDMLLNNKVDPLYRYDERGTCLEIACSQPNRGRFVCALLKKIKPSVNTIIPEPIHYAAREGADDAMAELLSHKETDVNAVTSEGETPLHYLATYYKPEERYRRCLQLLLNRPDIDINKANKNGYTIIHQAASNGKREMVKEILLKCRNELDLDSQYGHGRTARTVLTQKYPDLVTVFPSKKSKLYSAYSKQLLYAFNNRQLDVFRGLLHQVDEDGDAVFDANYRYGRPYNETCLEMACRQEGCEEYIKVLLEAGADPNQANPKTNKAPIHVAAEALNYEALKILLENQSTNANAVDSRGWTALHYAAASPAIRAIKLLQSSSNSQDQRSKEEEEKCKKIANFEKCTGLIHKYMGIPVNMKDLIAVTNSRGFPEVEETLKCLTEKLGRKIDVHDELREYLRNKQSDDFITKFNDCLKNDSKKLDSHKHEFLQLAIENHLTEVVSKLLDNNTDPNKIPDNGTPPLIMAVKQEDIEIMELLLHSRRVNVDITDRKGNTALHHAVRTQNLDSITALLNHGANIAHENVLGRTPLPVSSLQTLLDKSLKTNDKYFPGREYYEVIFDYALLTASKTEYEETAYSAAYKSTAGPPGQSSVVINVPLLKKIPSPVGLKAESEILHYISKHHEQYKNLLNHPMISSFLNFKWNCVRHFFYLNFIFYVFFFIILNSYIICSSTPNVGPGGNTSPPMKCYFIDPSDNDITSEYRNSTIKFPERKCYQLIRNQNLTESSNQANFLNCSEVMNNCLGAESSDFVDMTQTTVDYVEKCVGLFTTLAVLTGILAVRELLQIITGVLSYLKNIENYLDIGILSITITIMSLPTNNPYMESCRVLSILLSSCELILLLGREPFFSRNIEMLKTVTVSYMRLFLTFLAIILAFAHCLHIVFRQDMNKEGVYSGLWIICRTIVFMTGEYEADSLHFASMPVTSIAVFLLFVFFISIVLLNLLIGLSVNNTKMIEERSEVVCITSRIDVIYNIESFMLRFHNFFKRLNILTESVILFPKATEDKTVTALQNMDGKLKHNPIDNSVLRKYIYSLISAFREFLRNDCCLESRMCRKCRDRGIPKIDKTILENALKIISSNSQAENIEQRRKEKKNEMKQKLQDILSNLD